MLSSLKSRETTKILTLIEKVIRIRKICLYRFVDDKKTKTYIHKNKSGGALASCLFTKRHPTRTPKPYYAKIQMRTWGGQGRDTETRRDTRQANSPGDDRNLGARQCQQRGEQNGTVTAADAGMRRGAQGQAAEAGGRRVQTASRWAALRTNRGGGERVKI